MVRAKVAAEAKTDGRTLLRALDLPVDAADVDRGYKALLEGESGFRNLNQPTSVPSTAGGATASSRTCSCAGSCC